MAQSMSLARDNVTNCTLFDDADLHRWREGPGHHHASAARHRRRLPAEPGSERLVRRRQRKAGVCCPASMSEWPSIRPMASSSR